MFIVMVGLNYPSPVSRLSYNPLLPTKPTHCLIGMFTYVTCNYILHVQCIIVWIKVLSVHARSYLPSLLPSLSCLPTLASSPLSRPLVCLQCQNATQLQLMCMYVQCVSCRTKSPSQERFSLFLKNSFSSELWYSACDVDAMCFWDGHSARCTLLRVEVKLLVVNCWVSWSDSDCS